MEAHEVKDLVNLSEFVKDRLYFASFKTNRQRSTTTKAHFFSSDETYVYLNFFSDFGPLCLSTLYAYCENLQRKLKSAPLKNKVIIHYTGPDAKKRLNAAFLIGSFAIIHLKWAPGDVYRCLQANNKTPYTAFQDASEAKSIYTLELLDCFNALYKAQLYNIFDFQDFDVKEMEKYEKIQHGDISWIVPDKLLAFSGPNTVESNTCYHKPQFFLDYFHTCGVQLVVRLNQKTYDETKFTDAGISHLSLYFPDGSTPSNEVLCSFIKACEKCPGPVAVHCKAGLGRTGCVIGAYLIKHYKMSAMEAIAWMRICRPGCVIGVQQDWLKQVQPALHNVGDKYRMTKFHSNTVPRNPHGIYSKRRTPAEPPRCVGHTLNQLDKENQDCLKRTSPRSVSATPKKIEKNFVLENIKRPLTSTCRRRPVMDPETQADCLLQAKAIKARVTRGTITNTR